MKKVILPLALLVIGIFPLFGQFKVQTAKDGDINYKASTTLGVNFENETMGIKTQIDQLQFWFNVLPTSTLETEKQTGPFVRIKLEELQFALNYQAFNVGPLDNGTLPTLLAAPSNYINLKNVVSELVWDSFTFTIGGTWPGVGLSKASLQSLFTSKWSDGTDGFNSLVALPLLSTSGANPKLPTDLLSLPADKATTPYPVEGFVSGAYMSDQFSARLSLASKKSFDTNDSLAKANYENGWLYRGDVTLKPVPNAVVDISALGGLGFEPSDPETQPLAFGLSGDYIINLENGQAIKPFAGVDGVLEDGEFNWEAGLGTFYYFRGPKTQTKNVALNKWGASFNPGIALSVNVGSKEFIPGTRDLSLNGVLSFYDQADSRALLPNLGWFGELEVGNILEGGNRAREFGVAGQLEYSIGDVFLPYVNLRYVQGTSGGVVTGNSDVQSKVGLVITPVKNLRIDARYSREDVFGTSENLDLGLLTLEIKVQN